MFAHKVVVYATMKTVRDEILKDTSEHYVLTRKSQEAVDLVRKKLQDAGWEVHEMKTKCIWIDKIGGLE